jgi:hypothetical protein
MTCEWPSPETLNGLVPYTASLFMANQSANSLRIQSACSSIIDQWDGSLIDFVGRITKIDLKEKII